jgi:hypothetical protein
VARLLYHVRNPNPPLDRLEDARRPFDPERCRLLLRLCCCRRCWSIVHQVVGHDYLVGNSNFRLGIQCCSVALLLLLHNGCAMGVVMVVDASRWVGVVGVGVGVVGVGVVAVDEPGPTTHSSRVERVDSSSQLLMMVVLQS